MQEIVPEEEGIIKYTEIGEGERQKSDLFYIVIVLLVGLMGFGLGRLSKIEEARVPITIEYPQDQTAQVSQTTEISSSSIVASKYGTKYYFTWCSGAERISAKNRLNFASAAAAEAKGYAKAANCPGL